MTKNNVELSIDYIKTRVPKVIHSFHQALLNRTDDFLKISNTINNDRSQFYLLKNELLRNISKDNSSEKKYFPNHEVISSLFGFDPVSFLYYVSQGNLVKKLLIDYYQILKNSGGTFDEDSTGDAISNFQDNSFDKSLDIKTPFLADFNISSMSSFSFNTMKTYMIANDLPKIAVKSVINSDITSFTESNSLRDFQTTFVITCWNGMTDGFFEKIKNEIEKRTGVSELLVGQIDMYTLSEQLLRLYYITFHEVFYYNSPSEENNKEITEFIKTYQALFGIEENGVFSSMEIIDKYNDIQKPDIDKKESLNIIDWIQMFNDKKWRESNDCLNGRNPYSIFVFMNKLLEMKTKEDLDSQVLKYIEKIEEVFNKNLELFINRCIISTIVTFFAKIGQEKYVSPQGLNHEFIKKLIQITIEDVNNLNMELSENPTNYSKHEDRNTIINSFDKRKTSKIIRKRIFDFLMLCNIIRSEKNSNYTHDLPFGDKLINRENSWWDSNRINSQDKKGTPLYRFVVKMLQEIYSNMTYTINSGKNIVGYENGKFVYKSTLEMALPYVKKYLNDYETKYQLDDFIKNTNSLYGSIYRYDSERKPLESVALNTHDSVLMVSLMNHRSLASIYKIILHIIFKLLYVVGNYQELAKNEKIATMPPYLKNKYMTIMTQLNNVYNQLVMFKNGPGQFNNGEMKQFLYILHQFQSGKWFPLHDMTTSDLTDLRLMVLVRDCLITLARTKFERVFDFKYDVYTIQNTFSSTSQLYNNSPFNDEISVEFDLDLSIMSFLEDLVKTNVPTFSSNSPETMLMQSYESIREYGNAFIKNIAFKIDYEKSIKEFEKYLKNTPQNAYSLESLMSFAVFNDGAYSTLDKKTSDLETINKYQTFADEFDEKFFKAITTFSVN